jgi:hypothetical protein
MPVGQGDGVFVNAWKMCDVAALFQRAVRPHLLQKAFVSENQAWNTHTRLVARYAPSIIVYFFKMDLLRGSAAFTFTHHSIPKVEKDPAGIKQF